MRSWDTAQCNSFSRHCFQKMKIITQAKMSQKIAFQKKTEK